MKKLGIFLTTIAMSIMWSGAVAGQQMVTNQMFCAPSRVILKRAAELKQAPVAFGVINNGQVGLNVFKDAEGKSFTIILTNPTTGVSCVLAAGTDYQNVVFHLKPKGPDA